MKGFYVLLLVLGISASLTAQPVAMDGLAEYQKRKVPSAVIELPYPPETVEGALDARFHEMGFKSSRVKDYDLYRKVTLPPNNTLFDMYVMVEKKSRKEKDISIVHIILARPNELVDAREQYDKHGVTEGKEFLNGFIPHLEAYSLNLEIQAQEEVIKKQERKYSDLVSDKETLQRKKEELEAKIHENTTAVDLQKFELEKQKLLLESIKSRRKR